MQSVPVQTFDVETHLLRDRWMVAVDNEVERLRGEQHKIQLRIEKLLTTKAGVRQMTDPVCGLPKLEVEDDEAATLRIAAQFAPKPKRRLTLAPRAEEQKPAQESVA